MAPASTITAAEGLFQTGGGILADRPSPVSLTMPTPPSVNAIFKNLPGRGRARTREYDHWLAMAITALRQQRLPTVTHRVILIIGVERMSLNADIDNRMKASWDALVKAGVLKDDSLVTAFAAAWQPPANGLTRIVMHPATEPLSITFHPSREGASGGWFSSAPSTEEEEPDGHFTL